MTNQQKNLNLIQVLRGIASLLVVFFHATVNSNEILGKEFCFDFFFFGGSGVDIFFVLSGFIITYTCAKGLTHPGKLLPFLKRRSVRIFPTYWIIIALFLVIQLALPSFYKTHYNFEAPNLIGTIFLLPGHTMVNGVSWTLSFELFFYLLFSIAFLLPNKKLAFVLSMLYALVIIGIGVAGYNFEQGNKWINLISHPMNVEFFMGVLAAVLIPRISKGLALPLLITGSLLFLLGGILFNQNFTLLPTAFNRVVLFGMPSFFIITSLVKFELSKHINVHNILLSLGEASYSLYLLHLPIIAAGMKLIARTSIRNNFALHALVLLMIALICFASILFFRWIEKPIIAKLNGLGKKKISLSAVNK